VKIVNIEDPLQVMYLRNCRKSPKHLVFHPSGSYISVSCTDGIVYIYSLSTSEPELVRKVEGIARALEGDAEPSSRAAWHPDGRALGIPTATREIQIVSRSDGEKQKSFNGAHLGDVTALAWSPNGAMLATAAADGKIILWDSNTQKPIARSVLR
jgi:chromosome transmission fidelity protein 4